MRDHVRVDIHADAFEEIHQADALNHLAASFMFQTVLGPEVDDFLRQFDDAFIILGGVEFHKRHHHGAHQVADFQRALAADKHRHTLVVARRQRFGDDIQTVHALDAVAVVDFQLVIVGERDAVGRATRDDVVDDMAAALGAEIFGERIVVDFNVVAPTADDREVGALDGVGAVVGAAGDFELEFIRQRRAVNVVGEVVDQFTVQPVFVGARLLAPCRADA